MFNCQYSIGCWNPVERPSGFKAASMKLTDLDARFVGAGGEGIFKPDGSQAPERHGVGITFRCPCGCGEWGYVPFTNPLDGGPVLQPDRPHWERTGKTVETLTLRPSILRTKPPGCGWHGFVTNGEVVNA